MIHGDEKVLQMARSILPATRSFNDERARIHRASRRGVKAEMRALARDPEAWFGDYDDGGSVQREIGGLVGWRRGRDKLNHFERWAVARTREMPIEARLGHLAGVLPPGLIGEHAMSHLKRRPELRPPEPERRWRRSNPRFLDRGEAAQLLRRVVVDGHRALNDQIKAAVTRETLRNRRAVPIRLFHGLHDVLTFLRDISVWRFEVVHDAADGFLRRYRAGLFNPNLCIR